MPMFSHRSATRDRILAARDEFRAGAQDNTPEQQPAVENQIVPPPAQPQVQPEPQPVAPQPVAPHSPDDVLRSLYSAPQPVATPPADDSAKLREDNAKLLKEIEELKEQQKADKASLEEYSKLKEQQEIDSYLSGTESLTSVSAEDARKLLSPLLKSMKSEQERVQQRMAQDKAELDKRFDELNQREKDLATRRTYDAIIKAHPDLAEMQKHPAYAQVMSSPVGAGSGLLIGNMVDVEIKHGNADYVINVLNEVKRRMGTPSNLDSIASVSSSVPAAGTPVADNSGDILSPDDIANLRYLMQTKQISREEFRGKMQKHREASRLHKR